MTKRITKKTALKITGFALFILCAYIGKIIMTNNFHTLVPGEAYRSAQVDAEEIAEYKNAYNIRSIINLRGDRPGAGWYEEEVAYSKRMGITYLSFPMDSGRELTNVEISALIEKMKNAPKPILIHCENGANRTGLASALYMAGIKKVDFDDADDELSPFYGHINFGVLATKAMGQSFERFSKWQ